MRKILLTMIYGVALFGFASPFAADPAGNDAPLGTVVAVDVPRYLGLWYEIAKYPNRFQKQCVAETTATYSARPDGRLKVVNRCRTEDGRFIEAVGAARQVGGVSSPTLEVRFAPAWLSFLPWVWGDYWIIDLDADYQLAAVSEPRREYLWILSRSPEVSPAVYDALLDRLRGMGFDPARLERGVQKSTP